MKFRFAAIFFLILISLAYRVYSQDFSWEIITNLNNAKDLIFQNTDLYLATDGGFVSYSVINDSYEVFTTQKGITDHNFSTMTLSDKNFLILGTINGVVTFYDIANMELKEDYNLAGNEIKSIQSVDDTLWIALKDMITVYLYNADKREFEFRDFFPNFNRDFETFHQIHYYDKKIWAASNNGLFYASGNFLKFNLKSADNWTVLTDIDGLPHNTVYSLNSRNDTLLIGTENGISKYFNQSFVNLGTVAIHDIKIRTNNLYVGNTKNIYQLQGNSFNPIYQTTVNTINTFAINESQEIWISLQEQGVLNPLVGKRLWFNGPVDNVLGHLELNSRGELWVSSGIYGDQRNRGFSVMNPDGNWRNFRYLGNWRNTANNQNMLEDAEGNMWLGSWNGGLLIVDPDYQFYHFNNYQSNGQFWISSSTENDTFTVEPPDSLRHLLSYTFNAPDLLVVTSFLLDESRNCIWVMTPAVRSEKPIVQYKGTAFSDLAFDSTNWVKNEFPDYLNVSGSPAAAITRDIFNNLWIGSDRSGVFLIRFLENGSTEWFKIDESDNLKNNSCYALAGDLDGYVWLGTVNGLNAYFNGNLFDFREDYQPIGLRINDIFVDSENNKWFATDEGVSLLLSRGSPWDPESWIHFVPKTSEVIRDNLFYTNLPSKEIRSIFIDEATGDVYCSTASGLAILRSNPFTTPLKELSHIKVGPNPLTISDIKSNYIYFRNLTENSEVKILTSSGRLVRTLNLANSTDYFGSFARWDCRNQEGRLVSSGVYVFLVTDESGNSTSGKLLLIRE